VTLMHLEHNISKTARDRCSKGPPIGNNIWSIK